MNLLILVRLLLSGILGAMKNNPAPEIRMTHHIVTYRAARSARFEHGETP